MFFKNKISLISIIILILLFSIFNCNLIEDEDQLNGKWQILYEDGFPVDAKIKINTEDQTLAYYNSVNDDYSDPYTLRPYKFSRGKITTDNNSWLYDGEYEVYFCGEYMYWRKYNSSGIYVDYYTFKRI